MTERQCQDELNSRSLNLGEVPLIAIFLPCPLSVRENTGHLTDDVCDRHDANIGELVEQYVSGMEFDSILSMVDLVKFLVSKGAKAKPASIRSYSYTVLNRLVEKGKLDYSKDVGLCPPLPLGRGFYGGSRFNAVDCPR